MGVTTVATDFMTGLSGPAMVGVFAMLPWVAIGWINSRSKLN
jgi:hypothetical protein